MFEPERIDFRAFSYYRRLERLDRFVAEHYSEPITRETAAGVAGLEPTYFSRFFHQKTGVCFRDWLGWVRVDHAGRLLKERNLSITEVAFAVGFRDLRTFERACMKHTALSPLELKKRLRPC